MTSSSTSSSPTHKYPNIHPSSSTINSLQYFVMFSSDYLNDFHLTGVCEPPTFTSATFEPPAPLVVPDKFGYNYELSPAIDSNGTSSSQYSYGSSRSPSIIQRSVSSHSLEKNVFWPPINSPRTFEQYLDSDTSHVRRVFSAGDLNKRMNVMQQRSESPLSNESSSSIIEGMMSKACKYSPEEKKERIERYRTKRSQRNFTKKIKYACRKTLADSRPRIRGRFARNEDFDHQSPDQLEWGSLGVDERGEYNDSWENILEALSSNLIL